MNREVRSPLLLGALLAAVGLIFALARAQSAGIALGLPLDDAWIHCAFARHLARDFQWALVAGKASGGESSLLWPLVLAPAELFGNAGAPKLALLLGGISFLLLPGMAAALGRTRVQALSLAVLVALCGPLLFLGLSGMESLPALALGLAALAAFSQGRMSQAYALVAIAVALRPDSILLLGLLAVGQMDDARSRGKNYGEASGETIRALWPAVLVCILVVAALAAFEGSFPPATLGGRRWLIGLPPSGFDFASGGIPRLIGSWFTSLYSDLGAGRALEHWSFVSVWAWIWRALFILLMSAGLVEVLRRSRGSHGRSAGRLLVLWVLLQILFYGIALPDRGHLGRYQLAVYPLIMLLAVEGWPRFWRQARLGRPLALLMAGLLLPALLIGAVEAANLWGPAVDHIHRVHGQAAADLETRGDDRPVAAFDIGRIAYDFGPGLVDLSGLSDPRMAKAMRAGRVDALLSDRGVGWCLLPVFGPDDADPSGLRARLGLVDSNRLPLRAQREWSSREEAWSAAWRLSGNAFRQIYLYRVITPD